MYVCTTAYAERTSQSVVTNQVSQSVSPSVSQSASQSVSQSGGLGSWLSERLFAIDVADLRAYDLLARQKLGNRVRVPLAQSTAPSRVT